MENLDLGLNLGFLNDDNLDKLLDTLTLLENNINSLNSTEDNINIFSVMLRNAVRLKQELIDIKDIYDDINKSDNKNNVGSNTSKDKEDLNSSILDLTQQIKTLVEIYKSTQNDKRRRESDNTGSTGTRKGRKFSYEEDTELDRINNELRQNAKAYKKDYSNKRNLNTTDVFRKLSEDNVRALKEQLNMFEGLTKKVVNKLSDTNFNNIISNGFIKKIQEISLKTDKSDDYYSSVKKLISDISKQTGNDDFKNLSKVKSAIKQEELNVRRNEVRVKNYENMRKYGKEYINDTFFNSVKDFSKALKESENEIRLYNKKLYSGKINDEGLQTDLISLKEKRYTFDNKVNFEKRLNDYFQQNANKINNQGSYIDNLRRTASTVFFTKEMLGYVGNLSQFNEAKEFERNITSLGVSGGFNSKSAVNSEKSTLMQMTEKTGTNVNEMASSLREVIKTGRDYNQSVELVKNATLLASTSFEDVSTSIDILNSKLLALDMNIDSNSIKRISNKIYNVLDNTALDLKDIANAGKQTNPILNSMVDSAENKGRLQNKTIDEYKEQLIDVEQSFIGELRQQGKTGEQAGTVIRNLFTKLMSVDGISAKMLDRDLAKVSEEKLNKAGFRSAKELSDLWQSGDIEKALNGLSMLVSEGEITFSTIKKIVTERHSSSVVSVFNKINGDLEKFIKNMTEGKDLTEKNTQAMNNWSTSIDRLVNSIKNIGIASLTKGTNGAILGGLTGIANFVSGFNESTINSDNPIFRGAGLALPQGLQQGILIKGVSTQTRKFGIGNVNEAFKRAQERITDPEKLKEMVETKNEILSRLSENKGFKGFINNLDLASRSTENLTDELIKMSEEGTLSFENLKVGSSGLLSTLGSLLKPTLYMMAINLVINSTIEYYNSLKKLQEELNNLDENIDKTAELGTSIQNLKTNIDNLTKVETFKQKEFNYSSFIDSIINSNDKLKESFEALNNIKNTTFKSFSEIRKEMFDKYTKKEDINTSPAVYQTGRFSIQNGYLGGKSDKDVKGKISSYIIKEGNGLHFNGKTTRNELNMIQGSVYDEIKKNYVSLNNKYLEVFKKDKELQQIISGIQASDNFNFKLNNGKNLLSKIKENNTLKNMEFRDVSGTVINLKDITDKNASLAYYNLLRNLKPTEKEKEIRDYENKFDKYVSSLNTSAEGRIGTDKYKKLDDNSKIKEMLKEGGGKLPEFIVRATLKNQKLAKDIGEVGDLEEFNKYLSGFEGSTLEEKYKNMVQTMVSTSQNKQTMEYAIAWAKEGFNAIKQSYEEYYKQLDTFRQYRDSILEQINQSKQSIRELFLNKGMRNVVAEDMFTERRNAKNELISLDKAGLSKYNNQFRKEVASIDSGTIQNNPQAFMNFQASLKQNLNGQSELEYQIKQAEAELDKEKKKGIQEDIKMAEDKVTYLKQSKKLLEDEIPIIKQQLAMAQFNIRTLKELAEMSAQVKVKQTEIKNQVGVSFGNKGSSLQLAYDTLNAQRSAFNTYGKMGLQTQINSALTFDAGGKFLREVTGKSNYANVGMGDYLKVQKQIESYNKKVANTDMSKLNDDEKKKLQEKADNLQRTGGIISSVLGETMALEEKRLEFAQREKQIKIDIVKYWLEEQKLKTEYVESGEMFENANKQSNIGIISKMTTGDGELYKMNDLQEITNLKLEGNNLKLKDQLEYARRQIAVARENAQRQINAIRRLEGSNTSNSRKSENVSRMNTNAVNKTIVNSANAISANLVNAMNTMMANMAGSSDGEGGGVISNDIIASSLELTSKRETGKGLSIEASKSVSKDTGGSLSYGIFGVNNKSGSYRSFYNMFKSKFPELSAKDSPSNWKMVAQKYGQSFINAQVEWKRKSYSPNVFEGNIENFVRKYTGLTNESDIKRAGVYLVDASTQYGGGGLISAVKRGIFKGKNNINDVLLSFLNHEKSSVGSYFKKSLGDGSASRSGLYNGFNMRYNYSKNSQFSGGGASNSGSANYKPQKATAQYVGTPSGYDTAMVIQGASGLRMKNPKENTGGGKITKSTYEFAKLVQGNIKGFNEFTAFNDVFHHKHSPNSGHTKGLKFDFTINGGTNASRKTVNDLYSLAKQYGFNIKVLNEYTNPSGHATGGHLDVKVLGRGGSTNLTINNELNIPEEYVPKLDGSYYKELQKITGNEFTKDMIKTEADENGIKYAVDLFNQLSNEGLTDAELIKRFQNEMNEYILNSQQDLSVTKDVVRGAIDKLKSDMEVARDLLDKITSQYYEDIKAFDYSLYEMTHKVKNTNEDWDRYFKFLSQNTLAESFMDMTRTINFNLDKVNSIYRSIWKDINLNQKTMSMLTYLQTNNGMDLDTQEKRYKFLIDKKNIEAVLKLYENNFYEMAKKEFLELGLDKMSFFKLSYDEKQKVIDEMITNIRKKDPKNAELNDKAQNFSNSMNVYKQLLEYQEKNNEIRKTEIESFKLFNKSVIDFNNGIKEFSSRLLSSENTRSLKTTIKEYELALKGISNDSIEGKRQIEFIKSGNLKEQFKEQQRLLYTTLMTDNETRTFMRQMGMTKGDIKNIDVTKPNEIVALARSVITRDEAQKEIISKYYSKFIDDNPVLRKYADIDITNPKKLQEIKTDILSNSLIDEENRNKFLDVINSFENYIPKSENLIEGLNKYIATMKDIGQNFLESFKNYQGKSIDMLSSMLFGTDFEWQGLNHKEALSNLFDMIKDDYGHIKNFIGKVFNIKALKDKDIPEFNKPRTEESEDEWRSKARIYLGGNDVREHYITRTENVDFLKKKNNTFLDEKGDIYLLESGTYEGNIESKNKDIENMLNVDTLKKFQINGLQVVPIFDKDNIMYYPLVKNEKEGIIGAYDESIGQFIYKQPLYDSNGNKYSYEDFYKALIERNKAVYEESNKYEGKDRYAKMYFIDSIMQDDTSKLSNLQTVKQGIMFGTTLEGLQNVFNNRSTDNLKKNEERLNKLREYNIINKERFKRIDDSILDMIDLMSNTSINPHNLKETGLKLNDRTGEVLQVLSMEQTGGKYTKNKIINVKDDKYYKEFRNESMNRNYKIYYEKNKNGKYDIYGSIVGGTFGENLTGENYKLFKNLKKKELEKYIKKGYDTVLKWAKENRPETEVDNTETVTKLRRILNIYSKEVYDPEKEKDNILELHSKGTKEDVARYFSKQNKDTIAGLKDTSNGEYDNIRLQEHLKTMKQMREEKLYDSTGRPMSEFGRFRNVSENTTTIQPKKDDNLPKLNINRTTDKEGSIIYSLGDKEVARIIPKKSAGGKYDIFKKIDGKEQLIGTNLEEKDLTEYIDKTVEPSIEYELTEKYKDKLSTTNVNTYSNKELEALRRYAYARDHILNSEFMNKVWNNSHKNSQGKYTMSKDLQKEVANRINLFEKVIGMNNSELITGQIINESGNLASVRTRTLGNIGGLRVGFAKGGKKDSQGHDDFGKDVATGMISHAIYLTNSSHYPSLQNRDGRPSSDEYGTYVDKRVKSGTAYMNDILSGAKIVNPNITWDSWKALGKDGYYNFLPRLDKNNQNSGFDKEEADKKIEYYKSKGMWKDFDLKEINIDPSSVSKYISSINSFSDNMLAVSENFKDLIVSIDRAKNYLSAEVATSDIGDTAVQEFVQDKKKNEKDSYGMNKDINSLSDNFNVNILKDKGMFNNNTELNRSYMTQNEVSFTNDDNEKVFIDTLSNKKNINLNVVAVNPYEVMNEKVEKNNSNNNETPQTYEQLNKQPLSYFTGKNTMTVEGVMNEKVSNDNSNNSQPNKQTDNNSNNNNTQTTNNVSSKKPFKFVLYAGHDAYGQGGDDHGAIVEGKSEQTVGQDVINRGLERIKERNIIGLDLIGLARPNGKRSEEKNMPKDADAYASLHYNMDGKKKSTNANFGIGIIRKGDTEDSKLASYFGKKSKAYFGYSNFNIHNNGGRGDYFSILADKITGKNVGATMLELFFGNNKEHWKKVYDENGKIRTEYVDMILDAIIDYANTEKNAGITEGVQQPQEQPQQQSQETGVNANNLTEDEKPRDYIDNAMKSMLEEIDKKALEDKKEQEKVEKEKRNSEIIKKMNYALTGITVLDGIMKRELNYKKKALEIQAKILEMNLQMAETTEERRKIEQQILDNKLSSIDTEYKTNSSFMGGMFKGTSGFGIQGIVGGATQGASIGGLVGAGIGAGLGLVGGLLGGTQAKIQMEQQKSMLIAQQKLNWLAEDRNKYLKTMASAMSEQAKWTTKIGVNDAISRSVRAVISNTDTLGGTAYETRTETRKKKKGGGLLGKKKYDVVQAFTQSYNLNDPMFNGRTFDNRLDLEYAYTVLSQRLLDRSNNTSGELAFDYSNGRFAPRVYRRNPNVINSRGRGLENYLQSRLVDSSRELTSDEFLRYFNGQSTLGMDGLLLNRSRDNEIDEIINSLKGYANSMGASQEKVDTLALINFYENIKAVLDREGKTTKRLFGNYYGIETEEKKDEKGNITEYRRVNESMWSDYYNQIYQNVMNGTKVFDTGSKFISGTVNAFIQNVSSGRNSVKAITDEFNRLADQIYEVVTRTGEFTNVNGTIKSLIDNMFNLKQQQKETEKFTVDLAKRWVALGGNITDVIKDMNNGLTTSMESIKSTMLGGSMEETINNFGNNLWQKLGESMTTNLINRKYANDIFKMNGLLSNATDSNSISDIVNLANGYKGLSSRIESDRERLSAIQRLFTANRDIDYVDENIQYETGTSQSITNNYTFTTDINAGTIVADELSKELLAQSLFAPLVQMLKDNGFIH